MSIKNNTTLLNSLLEQINNLPDAVQAENLDEELSTQDILLSEQDAKIAELASILETKAAGGIELPELTNEGSASDLMSGKELIGSDGNVVIGTIETFNGSYECSSESTGSGNSGGSVETCTVTFDNESLSNDTPIEGIAAMVVDKGTVKPYLLDRHTDGERKILTISNVVCGSTIRFNAVIYHGIPLVEIDGSAVLDLWEKVSDGPTDDRIRFTFTAPSVANENCTIYYAYEP